MEEINVDQLTEVSALRDKSMPPKSITVKCNVLTYSAHDIVTLEFAEPQGINPTIMLVDVKVEKIDGPMKGTLKPVVKDFENNPEFEKVTVRHDSEEVTVDILGF